LGLGSKPRVKAIWPLLIICLGTPLAAQQTNGTTSAGTNDNSGETFFNPLTLASGLLERNFINVFAYGDGAYDSNAQVLSNGQTTGSFGYAVGGGIQASHVWRDAQFTISYSGGYQHYNSNFFINGPTQNLILGYTKRFGRRWTLSLSEAAGMYLYGQTYYTSVATNMAPIISNPFAPEVRFSSSNIALSYRQTRRLSYVVSGSFSLYRYNGPGGIGADDVGGSLGVNYQLTARTTIGGSYSYSYFRFQQNAGDDKLNGVYASLSHQFANRWSVFVSGGVTHSLAIGVIQVPVTILTGQNQTLTGYEFGSYRDASNIPSFQGTATRNYRRSQVSLYAGQGVTSGNGIFLASKDRFFGGSYTYDMRNSVFTAAGTYNRLTSVANAISYAYSSGTFTVAYSRNLIKYVSGNVRYDYISYGGLGNYSGQHDNHFVFGLSFSSKSIPLTIF
jgi:hypothetical protein